MGNLSKIAAFLILTIPMALAGAGSTARADDSSVSGESSAAEMAPSTDADTALADDSSADPEDDAALPDEGNLSESDSALESQPYYGRGCRAFRDCIRYRSYGYCRNRYDRRGYCSGRLRFDNCYWYHGYRFCDRRGRNCYMRHGRRNCYRY